MYLSTDLYRMIDKEFNYKKIPKAARELSGFLSLVYDETMTNLPSTLTPTYIRCFGKGCEGIISTELNDEDMSIHWKCSNCNKEGVLK